MRILSGVFTDETRHAGDDRHADRAADRQCRPALEGLFRHQGQVPSRPRRLHLRRQIRLARLSRRRAAVGARDRDAGRGRRDRAQGRAGPVACAARWCRWARTRSTAPAGTGTRSTAIPSSARTRRSAKSWEDYLDGIRKRGSSVGAVIEVVAEGVPAGLGAPVYGKLDGDLAAALMSINAVKGVEIGAGMGAAALTGEENADEMRMGNDGKPIFLSNHAGGILGGISTGQPIVARFAVKPTSSILTPRRTVDRYGNETEITTKGRHDPCVGIRAVPIGEAMVACVIADHYLRQRGQMGEPVAWPFARPMREENEVNDIHQRVEAVIAAFANGEIVVVTDDDDRENEGDLFVAASLCTPERMAFVIRNTSGIVCAPLASEEAKRLHLDPMVALNDAPLGTAFTVSVDVRHGLTTGISAEERNNTVRALANGNSGAADFVRPGHVFPLVAKEGGVLMRSGHTEACVDLCRLAGLPPVGVLAELMNDDGTVMRGPAVVRVRRKAQAQAGVDRRPHRLPAGARQAGQADRRIPGQERDRHAHRLRLCHAVRRRAAHGLRPRPRRRRSERAGAAAPRRHHPRRVRRPQSRAHGAGALQGEGRGVLVFLRDGAAGVPTHEIPQAGRSTSEAERSRQWREVGLGAQILKDLGISSIRLITSRRAHLCRACGVRDRDPRD